MKHRSFLLEMKVEGIGWDRARLLVAEPGPKQAVEVMDGPLQKSAAKVKEYRADGPEAIRTPSFLPHLNGFSTTGEPSPSFER